jgi:Nuclease-related domain
MQLKGADGRGSDIAELESLLGRSDIAADPRRRIEQEIRLIRAGEAGERDAAYEIEFHYGRRTNRVTIHDLRLEVGGRVAQIDHLVIDRLLTIWVCESKHFAEGVAVNDHGEWSRFFGGRPSGIPSPTEQNKRQIAVIRDAFEEGLVEFPKRLGLPLKPDFRGVVLVSNGARISRPRSKAAAAAAGLDSVIKVERFKSVIDADLDSRSLATLRRVISEAELHRIGRELVNLHRPIKLDWAGRFGLDDEPEISAPTRPRPSAKSGRGRDSGKVCQSCGIAVSTGVARYATEHASRFGGRVLCMDCQYSSSQA